MSSEVVDQFLLVMLITILKEITHSEIYHNDKKTMTHLQLHYPVIMTFGYVASVAVTIFLFWVNPPAAIAGFLSAFAWELLMPPITNRQKK